MKMRHFVAAASAALVSFGAIAGGEQQSESKQNTENTAPQGAVDARDAATVRQAQDRLTDKGYAPEGLREFQQAQGIAASGMLDRQTLAALGIAAPGSDGASSPDAARPGERPTY